MTTGPDSAGAASAGAAGTASAGTGGPAGPGGAAGTGAAGSAGDAGTRGAAETGGAAGTGGAGGSGDSAGSARPLAEELRLLLDAVAERAQPWLQGLTAQATSGFRTAQATGASGTAHESGESRVAHDSATCGWCPLCAGLALLRGERSDLTARAAEHLSGLLSVLRAAVTEPAAAPQPSEPDDEPQVQRIPVRRATGTSPC